MWLVVGVTTENPVTRGAWKRVVVVVALPEENFVIIHAGQCAAGNGFSQSNELCSAARHRITCSAS